MSEITDLAKTIREENEKTRAQQEKIANGEGPYAKETVEAAKASLKKQDEQRVTSMKLLGISEKRMAKAEDLTNQIQAQEQIMAAQKATLEESGVDADKTAGYQKEQIKLDKLNAKKDDATGAAASEDEAKAGAKDSKMLTYMKNTAGFLGGIAKQGMQKVKSGLGGFSKFLFGALAVAALAFLDHPKFKEIIITLKDVVIPALAYLYDEVIKPLALYIGGKLLKLFTDLKSYIDGEKGIGTVLMDNMGIVSSIVLALAVKTLGFSGMLTAIKGIGTALLWVGKGGPITLITSAATKIGVAFTAMKTFLVGLVSKISFGAIFAKIGVAFAALKTFFTATLLPAVTGFMVPLLPIIAIVAGIVLVLNSLKNAFDDFMFELEATGSIWEATKTGIVSVISNILGLPFDLIKDGVSWIIGKIGSVFGLESFKNAESFLDSFSFVDMIADLMTTAGDYLAGLFGSMLDTIKNVGRKILGAVGLDSLSKSLFGSKEDDEAKKKAKAEEQKAFAEERAFRREQEKLKKEAEEAKKRAPLEKKQAKMRARAAKLQDPNRPNISDYAGQMTPDLQKAVANNNIVNAPTSVVNANSSSNTTTSTPVRQPNMVIGMLASST